jgi:hypothetical protein
MSQEETSDFVELKTDIAYGQLEFAKAVNDEIEDFVVTTESSKGEEEYLVRPKNIGPFIEGMLDPVHGEWITMITAKDTNVGT